MITVTLPRTEYLDLKQRAMAYNKIIGVIGYDDLFAPPVKSVKAVIKEFKETGKYSAKFLNSLSKGLKRSDYFKK